MKPDPDGPLFVPTHLELKSVEKKLWEKIMKLINFGI